MATCVTLCLVSSICIHTCHQKPKQSQATADIHRQPDNPKQPQTTTGNQLTPKQTQASTGNHRQPVNRKQPQTSTGHHVTRSNSRHPQASPGIFVSVCVTVSHQHSTWGHTCLQEARSAYMRHICLTYLPTKAPICLQERGHRCLHEADMLTGHLEEAMFAYRRTYLLAGGHFCLQETISAYARPYLLT